MAVNGFDKRPQDINRNGAPKKEWTWGGLFKELSERGKNGKEVRMLLAKAIMKKAKEGDVQAFKEIANRMDGLPKQSIDLSTLGESLNYDEEQSRKIADRIIARGEATSGTGGEKPFDRLQYPDQ